MSDGKREREFLTEILHETLRTVYTEEGVRLWIAEAEKRGWSLSEQLERAEVLATGAFS